MRYEVLTGLRHEQLQELSLRILGRAGDVVRAGGRPAAIGLLGSVAMVVTLMRKNITQEVAGAIFGVSQATVSRRWDLLRPLIADVLAGLVPCPREIAGKGTLLVDGTVCPVWDWSAIPGLFSGKAGYPGMNVQIAATMAGDLAAVGPVPVRGARHDAHAFEASGLKDLIAGMDAAADLGYTGVRRHRHRPVPHPARRQAARKPGGIQHRPQHHPRRRRASRRAPEDLAHAQRGRRQVPAAARQIREHLDGHHRPILLQQLFRGL